MQYEQPKTCHKTEQKVLFCVFHEEQAILSKLIV